MALLSNINDKFAVDSTGAIQFNGQVGTSGYVLKSNANAAPTWVDPSTVIGGPYLPLSGGTLTGALAGTSATFSGAITSTYANVSVGVNGGYFRTAAANTDYNLITRNGTGNALFVQNAQSNSNQPIANFRYGSAAVNQGTPVLQVSKDNSHFVNCNVGIGETNPTYKFEVKGSGTNTLQRWTTTEGGALLLIPANDAANPDWTFIAGTNEDIQIDPANNDSGLIVKYNGNVGIGTTSPSNKLQIAQGHSILVGDYFQIGSGSSSIMGTLGWNRDTTNGVIYNTSFGAFQMHNNQGKLCLQGYNASGVNQFQHEFYNNGNIFFDGEVGIGTTSPGYKLDINGVGAFGVGTYRTYVYGNGGGSFIEFGTDADNDALGVLGTFASAMVFDTNQGLGFKWRYANNDRMTLTTGGNLGIGTTSPTEKLHVEGRIRLGSTPVICSHDNIGIDIDQNNNSGINYFRVTRDGELTELFRVQENGNVGIGTTSPLYPFSLENSGTGLISRIYNTNADGQGLLIRAGATTSGTRVFQAASSNDTKIMTVNSNGNVGIGTTSPGRKLTVTGDVSGDANNLLLVNENDTDGDSASIGFSMLSNNTYVKAGIFFKRTTTQGRGELILAVNNEVNSNNVTLSDSRLTINNLGDAYFYREIFAAATTGTRMRVPRNLFVSYGGSSFTYTFDPVALFGSNQSGGTLGLRVSGWQTRLFDGIIIWRNDGGGSSKIGTGVVTLVTVATNDFSGVGVSVSLPSANTNEIKISFSGFHSNDHGWSCYIKTEY